MLGKLLKYEFRATGRVFLPMYAVLLVMSFIARLYYGGQMDSSDGFGMSGTRITVILSMIMVMLFTAVWVVTLALILRRFWQNLLGREGYLMNVLPVSSWEHVGAKLAVSTVWTLLSGLVSVLALWLMLSRVIGLAGINWENVRQEWNAMWAYLRAEGVHGQAVLLIVQTAVNMLFSVIRFVLSVYAAMCVGQLVNKHRVWASIGAYFGISIVDSVLNSWLVNDRIRHYFGASSLIFGAPSYSLSVSGQNIGTAQAIAALNKELLILLAFTLAISAALYFAAGWILKKRLNLQ